MAAALDDVFSLACRFPSSLLNLFVLDLAAPIFPSPKPWLRPPFEWQSREAALLPHPAVTCPRIRLPSAPHLARRPTGVPERVPAPVKQNGAGDDIRRLAARSATTISIGCGFVRGKVRHHFDQNQDGGKSVLFVRHLLFPLVGCLATVSASLSFSRFATHPRNTQLILLPYLPSACPIVFAPPSAHFGIALSTAPRGAFRWCTIGQRGCVRRDAS